MALLTDRDRQYTTKSDICAHVGDEYEKYMGAIVPPIFQNSLFVLPGGENGVPEHGYKYTRDSNPTIEVAERKIAALEGADGALCFSSGMGAITAAILHFSRENGHVILVDSAYGPTSRFICDYLHKRFTMTHTLVDGGDIGEIENAVTDKTCLIYLESPSSFVFRMQDLEKVSALARRHGIGTVIDNTYATPIHQQPLTHGIDISCHTASKYLGGHSDIVAGALAARAEIIRDIDTNERELIGAVMDPHQAWLLTRGIRTLPLRLKQHGESAKKVAAFLESHPKVERVFCPGSATYAQKALFEKYMTGMNGLMSFLPKCAEKDVIRLVERTRVFQRGCSWGGFESLIITGMHGLSEEDARRIGVSRAIVRIHVGLEDADTLIGDLEWMLKGI